MTIEELRANLARMNVPPHKLDASKPTVCKWLLDNLYSRNVRHELFMVTMRGLLAHAISQRWLKTKEVKMYEDYLDGLDGNGPSVPTSTLPGSVLDEAHIPPSETRIPPSLQSLPKDHPLVKKVFTREGETLSRLDTGRISCSQPEMQEFPRQRDPVVKKIVDALKAEPHRRVLTMPAFGAAYGRPKGGKTVIGEQIAASLGHETKKT